MGATILLPYMIRYTVLESVAAYVRDLQRQRVALETFDAPHSLDDAHIHRAIFTGSGDSLAAAMLAESLSDYRIRAADPLEIYYNPDIVKDKDLYVISVSGRTITNIRLAQRFACTAITANVNSDLAKVSQRVIPLTFPISDVLTAGSASFLNSALVCMSLARPITLYNAARIFEQASRDAADTYRRGNVFFVGNQYTFPVAMYAAAKMYEIHGSGAHYSRTEQFAHMELFSVKPPDTVILFENADTRTHLLTESLESAGIRCIITDPGISDPVDSILYHIFYSQHLPLGGLDKSEVYFMEADHLRGISDSLIY